MLANDETRICNRCGQLQPITSYDKDSRARGGRRAVCKGCRSVQMKRWYADNQERQCGRQRERFRTNNTTIRERDRSRYYRDREARVALVMIRIDQERARHAGVSYDGSVTRQSLRERYGDTCHYCARLMSFEISEQRAAIPPGKATLEHVVPLSKGGPHSWENCVLACWQCNGDKKAQDLEAWLEVFGGVEGSDRPPDLHSPAEAAVPALACN